MEDRIFEIRNAIAELLAVPWCCEDLKQKANSWLEATDALIAELKEDICSIDDVIEYAKIKGDPEFMNTAVSAKEAGETICICDACRAADKVLSLLKP